MYVYLYIYIYTYVCHMYTYMILYRSGKKIQGFRCGFSLQPIHGKLGCLLEVHPLRRTSLH